jgi:signal transduction histidine kinase
VFVPDAKVPSLPTGGAVLAPEAFEHAARALGIGISIIDRQFRIIWTNHLVQDAPPGGDGGAAGRAAEAPGSDGDLAGRQCFEAYYGRGSICPGCLPLRSFATGEVYSEVSRRIGRDGTPRYLQITSLPIQHEDGAVTEVMEIAVNVTEAKLLEEQLAEAEKLALVGQMAAGLAHEIKNPLAGMKGAIRVLRDGWETIPATERSEVLREVERQVDRLNRNVEDLLAFSRPSRPSLQPGDLNDVVERVRRALGSDPESAGVAVRTVLIEDARGHFDPHLVEQALLNVAQNALQAMAGRGTLTLRTRRTADLLTLEVEDDGPGMTADIRRRAVEPFFTTRHRGTGLGLPIVRRIAETHGGHLELDSEPGRGTRVRILLPQP